MTLYKKPSLSKAEVQALEQSLLYLNLKELRHILDYFDLPARGSKIDLISMIIAFFSGKKIVSSQTMPSISIAKKEVPLRVDSLILKGSYKNDLKTRNFFKSLIGDYFHFTAFGIDWIKQRWQAGDPPTYGEFAEFWQKEYLRRKSKKASPKKEWAYITFLQHYAESNPQATQDQLRKAWHDARLMHVRRVEEILRLR